MLHEYQALREERVYQPVLQFLLRERRQVQEELEEPQEHDDLVLRDEEFVTNDNCLFVRTTPGPTFDPVTGWELL